MFKQFIRFIFIVIVTAFQPFCWFVANNKKKWLYGWDHDEQHFAKLSAVLARRNLSRSEQIKILATFCATWAAFRLQLYRAEEDFVFWNSLQIPYVHIVIPLWFSCSHLISVLCVNNCVNWVFTVTLYTYTLASLLRNMLVSDNIWN